MYREYGTNDKIRAIKGKYVKIRVINNNNNKNVYHPFQLTGTGVQFDNRTNFYFTNAFSIYFS